VAVVVAVVVAGLVAFVATVDALSEPALALPTTNK